MIKINFSIQQQSFSRQIDFTQQLCINVKSKPRDYTVELINSDNFAWIRSKIEQYKNPIILIDSNVNHQILSDLKLDNWPCYKLEATENNKEIHTVLKVCEFLLKNNANRGNMLFVIGGGILQDVGAFSAAMFKRGIPWCFIPTTLLSQADSCLGGKTAVNFAATKNVLGLFSAPRQVIIDPKFISSLSVADKFSGCGEILRLALTGGIESFNFFKENIDKFVLGDREAIKNLIWLSLNIKQAIVEFDEFELDIRRSMNYGHSIGHAAEAVTNYFIPHGQAVTLGILIENIISVNRNLLDSVSEKDIRLCARKIITDEVWRTFININVKKLLPYLANDKKAEGTVLKLTTIKKISEMKFLDLELSSIGISEVSTAFNKLIHD